MVKRTGTVSRNGASSSDADPREILPDMEDQLVAAEMEAIALEQRLVGLGRRHWYDRDQM